MSFPACGEANEAKFALTTCGCSSSGRAPPCQGGGSEFEPRHPLQNESACKSCAFIQIIACSSLLCIQYDIWRHSQVVRPRFAKPLRPSSNLGGASKKRERNRCSGMKPLRRRGLGQLGRRFLIALISWMQKSEIDANLKPLRCNDFQHFLDRTATFACSVFSMPYFKKTGRQLR